MSTKKAAIISAAASPISKQQPRKPEKAERITKKKSTSNKKIQHICRRPANNKQYRLSLKIRAAGDMYDALLALLNHPVITGQAAHIRDESRRRHIENPIEMAEAAIARANGKRRRK